jgi:LysM repeat protein
MKHLFLMRWLALIMVSALLGIALLGSQVVSAQCAVRTDWPVYIVVRGDTLARIASRYGVSVDVLVSANCLASANRIFAGQQLRVPPAGTVVTPAPGTSYTYNLRISYQTFERGFMIWRSDNGEISIYLGGLSGSVRSFPASSYGRLPDRPIATPPRPGLFAPQFGFGKVWSNFPDVQANLGWATALEVGYATTVSRVNNLFDFTLPDGRRVRVDSSTASWFITRDPLPPPVTPTPSPVVTTTLAQYQVYEGGFVVWEARTANVVVFYNNSAYNVYPPGRYAALPDNPVPDIVPDGRIRPAYGIGKVWGNFWDVRISLGWATTPEQLYTATFTTRTAGGTAQTCFNLADGRYATYARSAAGVQSWSYSGVCV